MLNDEEMKEEMAGTTAICVILKNQKIYCVSILIDYVIQGLIFLST